MNEIIGPLIGAGSLGVALGCWKVIVLTRDFLSQRATQNAAMVEAIKELRTTAGSLSTTSEKFSELPKWAAGNTKIAAANVAQITRLTVAVERLANIVAPVPATSPRNGLDQYSVASEINADKEFRIGQLIAENPEMTRDVAEDFVRTEQVMEAAGSVTAKFGLE